MKKKKRKKKPTVREILEIAAFIAGIAVAIKELLG